MPNATKLIPLDEFYSRTIYIMIQNNYKYYTCIVVYRSYNQNTFPGYIWKHKSYLVFDSVAQLTDL